MVFEEVLDGKLKLKSQLQWPSYSPNGEFNGERVKAITALGYAALTGM